MRKSWRGLTGFRLFDNQVSIQFAQSLFEFGTKAFLASPPQVPNREVEEAARGGMDTVFTFVYQKTADDPFVK